MLGKLSQIDQLTVGDHYYLTANDEVWYFTEYSSGKGYDHSPANQIITNLKHGVEFRCAPPSGRWYYKITEIDRVGRSLARTIGKNFRDQATFVPIPPSVVRADPSYDSRMFDVLQAFSGTWVEFSMSVSFCTKCIQRASLTTATIALLEKNCLLRIELTRTLARHLRKP